jgi:hypothetical protein
MRIHHAACWSRREFLRGLTLAGTAGLLGLYPRAVVAEPPPETTKIRLIQISGICIAPQYVAEELLRAEGFTEVQYIKLENTQKALASGQVDVSMAFVAPSIIQVDTAAPLVLLGGVHVGCYEVFGTDQVRAIRDLKGKTVAVPEFGSAHHLFLASALEPERAAQLVADKGYAYEYTLQTLQEIPYNRWREYDPKDTVRFYALRLYEVGMIKSSPQKIIAQGTDWRFLNELKKELKG